MARIGIMGGTFDPIHNGHLRLGKQAYEEYQLDEIWFMPSGQPPHKTDHVVTDGRKRCTMVKLAIAEYSQFLFSDFEFSRTGNTYTADTICRLKERSPEHDFFFIIGADSLYQMEAWYHPEIILASVPLLVAGREYEQAPHSIDVQIEYLKQKYQGTIFRLHSPEIDISSARLRKMAADGKSLERFVPPAVAGYIKEHHLYEVASHGQ